MLFIFPSKILLTLPTVFLSLSFMRRYCTGRDLMTVTLSFGAQLGVRTLPLAPPSDDAASVDIFVQVFR